MLWTCWALSRCTWRRSVRLRAGQTPIAPDEAHFTAQDFMAMLGLPENPARARALDTYWVTVSDHGLNASTFAARVVASTGSDVMPCHRGGAGRAQGAVAWWRSRSRARYVGRNREHGAEAVARAGAGRGPADHGHGASHLSRARSACVRVRTCAFAATKRRSGGLRHCCPVGSRAQRRTDRTGTLERAPSGAPTVRERRILHCALARGGGDPPRGCSRPPSPSVAARAGFRTSRNNATAGA